MRRANLLRSTFGGILFAALDCSLGLNEARAEPELLLVKLPGKKVVVGLEVKEGPLEPKIEPRPGTQAESKLMVTISGKFDHKLWSLLHRSEALVIKEDGSFSFNVEVQGAATRVPLSAVGPRGNLENANFEVRTTDWAAWQKRLAAPALPAENRFSARMALGPTLIFFNDARYTPATLTALTLTGGASYVFLPPKWEGGLSAYFNLLPLTSSFATTQIRFLGLNARVGYRAPWLPSPWALKLQAGWYYLTMIVSTNDRGFASMNGPQLYPSITYTRENGHRIGGYLKYSPMFNGFSVMSLGNSEIAAGGSYALPRANGHRILFNLDYSTSWLLISGVQFATTSFSLSAGYEI